MENLNVLRTFKQETLEMDFNYKNVHRIMYLIYQSKSILENPNPIPNKDIAHDQITKLISGELLNLINADTESEIKEAFIQTLEGFKLILNYTK